ncbi:MAG: acyl-CoA dehydrogenase family protein [Candidatus Dormibacteraeota bacterium]|uniref:Acyl-CoA dehydrogenase family protein n=1 Tax=Candidatus Dormiibacter inghamiae TaxID=3127013 RepID=A0A934KBS8_9BACT|nr:acyl-CoA dehydrogenase family protein [Candidatus Dormibacteraeota bacterium]MBJ7607023.1 acyl-CoA dehydrogenase family protein [Candidatus Dormibacteraeota bacterium]
MQLEPSAEQLVVRDAVRDFAEAEVRPKAAAIDSEHAFPRDILRRAAELGLMGMLVPRQYGGAGLDHLSFTLAVEELARACASTAVIMDVHNSVASEPIVLFGSEPQKQRWLPALAGGSTLGGFALTEPGSGSDAAALNTSARRVGQDWVLNGTKVFITNVGEAGLYLVFARTAEEGAAGISAFLVPAESAGLKVGQVFRKMGLNGSVTGELVLEEAKVPAANLLGPEGGGFAIAMRALDSGRIGISGQALGIARAVLEGALDYTRRRHLSGRQVALDQGVSFVLADLATLLTAGRQLAHNAASLCSAGRPFTREAAMAKLFCTDLAMEVASQGLDLAGCHGYLSDQPFERHFRDAKALQIYEGTNQIQRLVIARSLLRGRP